MTRGWNSGVGSRWQPDGAAVYKTNEHGTRVVVLPAHCRSGLHVLTRVGYSAYEEDQILRVSCRACRAIPRPDHSWALRTEGGMADVAEFDDAPYTRAPYTRLGRSDADRRASD